jgi:hypothetical protein
MKVVLIILAVIAGIAVIPAMLYYLIKFIIKLIGAAISIGWNVGKYIVLILLVLGAIWIIGWLIAEFA